jgi:holliday junction DNA helicase RuvA
VIGRLEGAIVERNLDGTVVLDVGGVGYELAVPMGSLGKLGAAGERTVLHVHTHVREDQIALFGFATADDRAVFRILLGVSSVGPKLAMSILSHLSARELARAIARKDAGAFKGISGVGKKIADRLVLELADKLALFDSPSSAGSIGSPLAPKPSGTLAQVASVLVGMGFKPSEADRAVAALGPAIEGKTVDGLLREALATMG